MMRNLICETESLYNLPPSCHNSQDVPKKKKVIWFLHLRPMPLGMKRKTLAYLNYSAGSVGFIWNCAYR